MNLNQRTENFCRAVTRELVRLRQESGLSQNQLAPPSGLNQSTINLLEAGKTTPTVASLFRLAAALGVSPAKILETALESCAEPEDGLSRQNPAVVADRLKAKSASSLALAKRPTKPLLKSEMP